MTVGISVKAVSVFSDIYNKYQNTKLFNMRLEEIELTCSEFYKAQDEKKEHNSRIPLSKTNGGCYE